MQRNFIPSSTDCFKREWVTSGTNELRETKDTYLSVAFDRLPSVPSLDSEFLWLSQFPDRGYECSLYSKDNAIGHFSRLEAENSVLGFAFPVDFRLLMCRPDLQERVPSCTACYLELSATVIPLQGCPGRYVIRFMNDSQCSVLWYLLFQLGGRRKY